MTRSIKYKRSLSGKKQVGDCPGTGVGEITKRHEEDLGGDRELHHLHCDDSFMGVHIYQSV